MKEVKFYVMCQKGGIVGVVKRTGIEFKFKGIKLYAYESDDYINTIYIIIPDTGLSIFKKENCPYYPDLIMDCITDEEIEKVAALMENQKYQQIVKVFNLYKKAAIEYERYLIMVEKERQQA